MVEDCLLKFDTTTVFNGFVGPGSIAVTLELTARYPVSTSKVKRLNQNLKQQLHFNGFVGPGSLKKLGYEVENTTTASDSDLISGTTTTSDSGLIYSTENIIISFSRGRLQTKSLSQKEDSKPKVLLKKKTKKET